MNRVASSLSTSLWIALSVSVSACASTNAGNGVMSARDHEAAAAAEKAEAREHANRYDPRAVRYLAEARKHRQAAQALRDAETRACSQIAFRDRESK